MSARRVVPSVQVFGRRESADTRRALRFFKERRVPTSFVDLRARPLAPTELRRFTSRFGARALFDTTSRAWRDAGLEHMRMDEAEMLDRLLADPSLLRLPLVRAGERFAIGPDEAAWKAWLSDP